MSGLLLPLKPIQIKEHLSILFVEKWHLDVLDGAFVVVERTHVPYWWRGATVISHRHLVSVSFM